MSIADSDFALRPVGGESSAGGAQGNPPLLKGQWAKGPKEQSDNRQVGRAELVSPARTRAAAEKAAALLADATVDQQWRRFWWSDLPAWMTSLIVHMVLIILFGLSFADAQREEPRLVLATEVNSLDMPGEAQLLDALPFPEFDEPGAENLPEQVHDDPFGAAFADVPSLSPDMEAPLGLGTALGDAPDFLSGPPKLGDLFKGRDPRVRGRLVTEQGGTEQTEAAVARGLVWLSRHQSEKGSFSLHAFAQAGDCGQQCSHGGIANDVAGTALALLPFLGAGQTHREGDYQTLVQHGLRYLLARENGQGDLRGDGNVSMYAHAIATIALCEAFALTKDSTLVEPAQRCVDFIVAAQHPAGGWRYQPGMAGDTSVIGWQLMALRSAQMAYLKVPEQPFKRAALFLDSVQMSYRDGRFGYLPGMVTPSAAMTAEGLLCRQFSGWRRDDPAMASGSGWLLQHHLPSQNTVDMYYWYYGTQVMHHLGGEEWRTWNYHLRDLLVDLQETAGHQAGSWMPKGGHDGGGGRLYMTALAVCTLEVYYRHLPLYRAGATDSQWSAAARSEVIGEGKE